MTITMTAVKQKISHHDCTIHKDCYRGMAFGGGEKGKRVVGYLSI